MAFDDESGEDRFVQLDPDLLANVRMSVTAVVIDAHGLPYVVASAPEDVRGSPPPLLMSLNPRAQSGSLGAAQNDARLDAPLQLARLTVELWLPDVVMLAGVIGIRSVAALSSADGPATDMPLDSAGPWRGTYGVSLQNRSEVPISPSLATAVEIVEGGVQPSFGWWYTARSATAELVPASLASGTDLVPVVANRAFIEATDVELGATMVGELAGRSVRLLVTGVAETFPTTDPDRSLVIIDEPTLALLRLAGSGPIRSADEWWLATGDGAPDAVVDMLGGSRFDSVMVVSASSLARSLSTDPVALGIIGALAVGFVATGLFALVGLIVSASVSARQRRTEFALLRALGLTGRQLSSSLWLENGSLVVVSLLAGTGLGLVIGWVVLPFVTVTQRAATPVPPVEVHVPWDAILLLNGVSVLALGVAVIVLGTVLNRLGVGSVLRMGED